MGATTQVLAFNKTPENRDLSLQSPAQKPDAQPTEPPVGHQYILFLVHVSCVLNITHLKNTPGIFLKISFIPSQFVTPPKDTKIKKSESYDCIA